MLENLRLSFQGIWSHKMRSFLTMLGIIIGIAAIIAIVSTIQGTNEQIKQNLIGSGNNTVNVELYTSDYTYDPEYDARPEGVSVISDATLKQICDLEGVEGAAVYNRRQGYNTIYYNDKALSGGYVYGIAENYFDTCGLVASIGRTFDQKDLDQYKKVCVLDQDSANGLFQETNPVGKTIQIKGEPYVIIGVVTRSSEFEPVIESIEDYYTYMQSSSGNVYIPITTWQIPFQFEEPQNLVVRASSTDEMTKIGKSVENILNATITAGKSSATYKSQDLLKQAQEIQDLSQSTNTMLIWIAGISLIVGGIGVMNIMLVSVTERTQEIGLKKAVGARKKHILGQFLTESAVLTCMGGVIGVVVGIILAEVISKVSATPISISIPAAVIAVLFSIVIGIVFGLLPAYKAANLNPIDALRRE